MTRQQQRRHYRALANACLNRILPVRLPRRIRRVGARAYATCAYRDQHGLPQLLPVHRYSKITLNRDVRNWVLAHGRING